MVLSYSSYVLYAAYIMLEMSAMSELQSETTVLVA